MYKQISIVFVASLYSFSSTFCSAAERRLPDPTRPLGYKAASTTSEDLKLQAIFFGNGRKEAIISGIPVKEGGKVQGRRVLAIKKHSILIEAASGPQEIRLRSSIFSK